ncbi:Predicted ATP-dependent carboligase, ATP-grasp superfamily [Haladaptatus litoreus]|uniref:Predicted ATP-dependent carboligase, ATP-grasp superfamily n=1 Tax=Haladaptatus litoreus TaxID=553468 RepID=A0A1N6Y8E5_9EURY|nr:carboxylate--amine ligase [Haladaptatus litoreus]SIR10902.1 Predicted ATP-dependent carboligase, ATP-grasp superfamily [Haladaptatus litoreus]
MAEEFRSFDGLRQAVAGTTFDRPPAIVCNAHVTGLSVARALSVHDVPVIAIDRNGKGVAPYSDAVDFAGQVTYPLDDRDGFREDVEALAGELEHEPVAFPCMDEWVHAFAGTEPEGVRLPFAGRETIDAVLNKESLYEKAEELGVPYPETYRMADTAPETALENLSFPFVVKPALKREFEEAVGTNVIEVADEEEFLDVVAMAEDAGINVMAQEKVDIATGRDCSLASYVPQEADPVTFVGNARVRYPQEFGTSCLVRQADQPEIEERALSILEETGYYGISESEFVYDQSREEYVLLDINTRPWKWISLPVQAGADLPGAAYAEAVGEEFDVGETHDAMWVYLADYLKLLANDAAFSDVLDEREWRALFSGEFEELDDLTTGVYRPSDVGPSYRLLKTEFGTSEYYCSC